MKRIGYFLFTILIFVSCSKDKKENSFKKLKGAIFGTTYNITYQADKNYTKEIDSLFALVNNSLSTYLPTSIISRINQNDSTVVADDFLIEVFNKSKQIFNETNGYFDPTFGKIINAYGFGSGQKKDSLTTTELKKLMKLVGFEKVSLKNNKIHKQNSSIELNVNAIAKGYGIDVIGRFLEKKGVVNYLVEIGGEIRARGKNSKNKLWTIAIDDPNTDGTRSQSILIKVNNQSVASSGNYRKFRIAKNGKKYVHILNPKTGLAQESDLISATVISNKDCADVDAYATAFMAMGFKKTTTFLKKHPNIKAILLYIDKNGAINNFSNLKNTYK